jgi:hypothetical protein
LIEAYSCRDPGFGSLGLIVAKEQVFTETEPVNHINMSGANIGAAAAFDAFVKAKVMDCLHVSRRDMRNKPRRI